jgi:hypothetical protein
MHHLSLHWREVSSNSGAPGARRANEIEVTQARKLPTLIPVVRCHYQAKPIIETNGEGPLAGYVGLRHPPMTELEQRGQVLPGTFAVESRSDVVGSKEFRFPSESELGPLREARSHERKRPDWGGIPDGAECGRALRVATSRTRPAARPRC